MSFHALMVLHYLLPLSVLLSFIGCRLVALNRLSSVDGERARLAAFVPRLLQVSIGMVYIVELAIAATDYWQRHEDLLPDDHFIYLAGSAVLFTFFGGSRCHEWYNYVAISTLTMVLELVILAMSASLLTDFTFALRVARLTAFTFTAMIPTWTCRGASSIDDAETQPLLKANQANGAAVANGVKTNDDAVKADDESEYEGDWRRPKVMVEKQKKRMQESGSLWNYMKGYKVFLPYMLPNGDRKIQLCLLAMMGYLITERLFLVLIPRQIGIVASSLTESQGSFHIPWQPILVWLLLKLLDSSACLDTINNLAKVRFDSYLESRLYKAALHHVLHLSMDFHDDSDSAEIMTAVSQGSALTNLLDEVALTILPTFFDFVISFAYIETLFGVYASFAVALSMASYLYIDILSTEWNVSRRRHMTHLGRQRSRKCHEAMQGWRTIVDFNRLGHTSHEYAQTVDDSINASLAYFGSRYRARAVQSWAGNVCFSLIIVLVAFLISRDKASVGGFVTLIAYWSSVWLPVYRLSSNLRWAAGSFIDAEKLLVLFNSKPKVLEHPNARQLHVTDASIRFCKVDFGYDERKRILNGVDFVAEGGKTIALVGETGSGKSTTLKLLQRFYDPSAGTVEIDGQNIAAVTLDSLRDAVGIVPQDTILFNSTVMENVKFGKLGATDEEVYDACKAAAIHDKILTFPDGYKSKVGSRGVKLSGGEKQRVSIARCLLKNPRILLLDEASSSLDSATEARVQEALQKVCTGRTTIAIAHRLSTIVHSDLILLLHEGEIVERGTHQELLKSNGRYRKLWDKQVAAALNATSEKPEEILKE